MGSMLPYMAAPWILWVRSCSMANMCFFWINPEGVFLDFQSLAMTPWSFRIHIFRGQNSVAEDGIWLGAYNMGIPWNTPQSSISGCFGR